MRVLTYSESAEWCAKRGFSTRQREGYVVGPEPDLTSPPFHFVEFKPPVDSGNKVFFARWLYSLVDSSPELLLWIGDWAVWPSSQHMPLFDRFREGFGERRPLIEAPGHILTPQEAEDSVSIIAVALFFIWDCHILAASGRDAVFVSHDEVGWFASRDPSVTESVRIKLSEITE